MKLIVAIFTLLIAMTSGISTAYADSTLPTTAPPPPPLNWQPCPEAPTRDCATLTVPLDYADLSKGTIDLPVARAKATDSANTIGPLLFNLGGPGIPSVGTVKFGNLEGTFSPELVSRFDIIGFDPRGTTNGIDCYISDAKSREYWEANHLPRTNAEINYILGLESDYNQACLDNNDPLVRHVNTASVIRDMEQLRRALDVPQISYIGFSYGTFIGNRYANLYPGKLRAMVLDAGFDRSVPDGQNFTESSIAYEASWHQFKNWCQQEENNCQLKGENIDAVLNSLLEEARTNPIPAPYNPFGNRPVNDWQLTIAIQAAAAPGSVTFAWVDEIISKARTADASLASLIYDSATGYDPSTDTYSTSGTHRSIICEDTTWSEKLNNTAKVKLLSKLTKTITPRFGEANVFQGPVQCFDFPVAAVETPPVPSTVIDNSPTLVIGATKDATTPLLWSARMAHQISGSRLLIRKGYGHISLGKSRCVESAVNDALVRLTLPSPATLCETDPDLYSPEPPPILGPTEAPAALSQQSVTTPYKLPEIIKQSLSSIL